MEITRDSLQPISLNEDSPLPDVTDANRTQLLALLNQSEQQTFDSNPNVVIKAINLIHKFIDQRYFSIPVEFIENALVLGINNLGNPLSDEGFKLAQRLILQYPAECLKLLKKPILVAIFGLVERKQSPVLYNLLDTIITFCSQELFNLGVYEKFCHLLIEIPDPSQIDISNIIKLIVSFHDLEADFSEIAMLELRIVDRYIQTHFESVIGLLIDVFEISDDTELYAYFFSHNLDIILLDCFQNESTRHHERVKILKAIQGVSAGPTDRMHFLVDRGVIEKIWTILGPSPPDLRVICSKIFCNFICMGEIIRLLQLGLGDFAIHMFNEGTFPEKKASISLLCGILINFHVDPLIFQFCCSNQIIANLIESLELDQKGSIRDVICALATVIRKIASISHSAVFENPLFTGVDWEQLIDTLNNLDTSKFMNPKSEKDKLVLTQIEYLKNVFDSQLNN